MSGTHDDSSARRLDAGRDSAHAARRAGAGAADLAGVAGTVLVGLLALCQPLPPGSGQATARNTESVAKPPAGLCGAGHDAFLRGELHGGIAGRIDWSGAGLECDGMLRPGATGVRLQFAGDLPAAGRLVLILGIDGPYADLEDGEWPVNLTVVVEGTGEFFNSGGGERCWTRVDRLRPMTGTLSAYQVEGDLWCTGAIPSLSDRTSVLPGELRYSGRFDSGAG